LHRKDLIDKITSYSPELEVEKEFRARFLNFIKQYPDCFERTLQIGHITGSAWIVNQQRSHFLMTHHNKLDRWLQLGGHADGDSNIARVATKEAEEESGLQSLKLWSTSIFDLDIHTIPARKHEPEHLHYDVRFLFIADDQEELVVSAESKDLKWLSHNELEEYCACNDSILRMAEKVKREPSLQSSQFKL